MKSIVLISFGVSAYLLGLIWTIQILHYPSFTKFSNSDFLTFHHFHTERITWIVGLPMLLELLLAVFLLWNRTDEMSSWIPLFLLGLVLLIWFVTFGWAVPLHNRLAHQFNLTIIQRLITLNWIRTVAWTLRTLILGYWLWKM